MEISTLSGGPSLLEPVRRSDYAGEEAFDTVRRFILDYWQTMPWYGTPTSQVVQCIAANSLTSCSVP